MSPPPFFRPCRDTIKTSQNQKEEEELGSTLAEGRKAVACSRPLDPKSTQRRRREEEGEEEEESNLINLKR